MEGPVSPGNGPRTFVFTQAQPIPPYALSLHLNCFERVTGPPVAVGVGARPPRGATISRTQAALYALRHGLARLEE